MADLAAKSCLFTHPAVTDNISIHLQLCLLPQGESMPNIQSHFSSGFHHLLGEISGCLDAKCSSMLTNQWLTVFVMLFCAGQVQCTVGLSEIYFAEKSCLKNQLMRVKHNSKFVGFTAEASIQNRKCSVNSLWVRHIVTQYKNDKYRLAQLENRDEPLQS